MDSTLDEDSSTPPNGSCTLREAVIAANTNAAVDGCAAGDVAPAIDTIELPSGTYLLDIAPITLALSDDVIVSGNASPIVERSVQPLGGEVFRVESGVTAELHGLTIRGGVGLFGGGIVNHGTLTAENCTIDDNYGVTGGGVYNEGDLTLAGSTVSNNTAGLMGCGAAAGGVFVGSGTALLGNSTISQNGCAGVGGAGATTLMNSSVSGSFGVGIDASGAVTLANTIVDDNCSIGSGSVTSVGGNVESPGNTCGLTDPSDQVNVTAGQLALGALTDNGGPTETHALGSGSVAIDAAVAANCPATDQRGEVRSSPCDAGAYEAQPIVVTDCTTYGPGLGTLQAALALGSPIGFACSGTIVVPEIPIAQDLAISAEGYAVTLSGNGANRIFAMAPGANLEVGHLTLSDGSSSGDGGAILNDGGNLIVSDSVLCDNSATSGLGGAIGQVGVSAATSISNTTLCRNTAGGGGAVGLGSSGSLDISTSSLWQNTALGPGFAGVGGALAILFGGSFTIDNSTVSGNIGPLGAIAVGGGGLTGSITHSTVAFNTNGGIFSTPITLAGTIVANNPGGTDCIPGNIDGGHNLDSDGSCFWTDPSSQSNTDPLLRSLADNGGPTQTHAFFPGSLAIDAGGACAATTDQRGVSRPQGTACDVGAFEVDPGCGDGFLNPALGEQCDDGNTADGDCCSATCQFQDALGVGGMPNCCSAGACQTGAGCGAICFTPGAICKQDGGPGTACTCELP